MPVIGQGTAGLDHADRKGAIEALRRGIDLGMRHIDTAEKYGGGRVEPMVAEAIQGQRDRVFLVSKVSGDHATRDGTIAACEASLGRLRTDVIDCYLLHWPSKNPLERTIEAFERLMADGKIRSWGVSNFGGRELRAAIDLAGEGRIACNQVVYHLRRRDHERDVLPLCREHGIAMVGYSPLAGGDIPAGRGPEAHVLGDVAEAHGATPQQVMLAFLLRHREVFVIPKATTLAHVEDNAAAAEIELGEGEIATLEAAFPAKEPKGR